MNFYFSFRAICFQKFDFYQFALKNKSFMHTCLLYTVFVVFCLELRSTVIFTSKPASCNIVNLTVSTLA